MKPTRPTVTMLGDIRLTCPWWDEPGAFGRFARGELKINKRENPRDHALIYTHLAEKLASEKLGKAETIPMSTAMEIVWEVAKLMGKQAKEVSNALGYDLVTEKPLLAPKSHTAKSNNE